MPVQTASRQKHPKIIELLLKHGVPVLPEGVQVWQENSPLYIASRYGLLEIANLLLAHNPCKYLDWLDRAGSVPKKSSSSCKKHYHITHLFILMLSFMAV